MEQSLLGIPLESGEWGVSFDSTRVKKVNSEAQGGVLHMKWPAVGSSLSHPETSKGDESKREEEAGREADEARPVAFEAAVRSFNFI